MLTPPPSGQRGNYSIHLQFTEGTSLLQYQITIIAHQTFAAPDMWTWNSKDRFLTWILNITHFSDCAWTAYIHSYISWTVLKKNKKDKQTNKQKNLGIFTHAHYFMDCSHNRKHLYIWETVWDTRHEKQQSVAWIGLSSISILLLLCFIPFPNSDPFICCLDAFIILCGLRSLHLLHLLVINFLVFIFYSSMHSVCVSLDCVGRLFPANVHVHFFFCLFCKYVFDKIMSPQGSIQSYSVFILLNLNVNKATYSHSKL